MSRTSCQRCGLLVPMRWPHAGGALSRPNHSPQGTVRPLIRRERPLKGPGHSSHLPRLQTSRGRLAGVPPTIHLGATVKSP
jgi:hypothetical protein